jgi:hypothetical protein
MSDEAPAQPAAAAPAPSQRSIEPAPEPAKEEQVAKAEKQEVVLADPRDPSTHYQTDVRVTMSAPGYPGWVITGDRTYYRVRRVETPEGLVGEIDVHPGLGHVVELAARDAGMSHRVK